MGSFNMPADKLLTLCANLLHAGFINRNKAKAKKDFKKLASGEKLEIGNLGPKESEEKVDIVLSMDARAFKGMLTFHLFEKAMASMLQAISKRLNGKEPDKIQTFSNQENNQTIFFVPGFVQERDILNMLVCSVKTSPGKMNLQLMFLDPEQFRKNSETEETAENNG